MLLRYADEERRAALFSDLHFAMLRRHPMKRCRHSAAAIIFAIRHAYDDYATPCHY